MNKLLKVEPLDTAVEVTQENQAPQGRCTELQERILDKAFLWGVMKRL